MRYRTLGESGIVVSEIGFGAWGIGGVSTGTLSYGPTDDEKSERALRRAFDLGVTFYDTSDLYGCGHSEELIGNAFRGLRDRVVLATKGGLLNARGSHDFSPEHITRSVEASLRRLRTDYIDVYQLHNPPLGVLEEWGETLDALDGLRQAGKIRALGISVRGSHEGLVAVKKFGFKIVQVNFNLVDQRILENGFMDLCRAKGVGLICRTPLCFGFLTGKYSGDKVWDPHDHRSQWPVEQVRLWAAAHRVFGAVVDGSNQTPAQIALRFCLSYPSVSTTIPGMLTREQVEENVRASELGPLTEVECSAMEGVYRSRTFFLISEGRG